MKLGLLLAELIRLLLIIEKKQGKDSVVKLLEGIKEGVE